MLRLRLPFRVLLLLSFSVSGCAWDPPLRPACGYELGDEFCADGLDNDGDGATDCADNDCATASSRCGEVVPLIPLDPIPEGPFRLAPGQPVVGRWLVRLCTDRIDNDGDGLFDCGDSGCRQIPELCCGRELDDRACADGRDNDGNGTEDCEDPSCRSSPVVTVCAERSSERCDNSRDDDGDGTTDCEDPGCAGAAVCRALVAASATREDDAIRCADGRDNDGDGYVDCNDFDCLRSEVATVRERCVALTETTPAACQDGIDNDGDGHVDCADRSCAYAAYGAEPEAAAACAATMETTPAACQDGIDNDGNGYADCADHSCQVPGEDALSAICRESAPESRGQLVLQPDERCSDGIDNDGDGFTDCADWDCSYDELVTVCPGRPPRGCEPRNPDPPPSCARPDGDRLCP
ncbi:MAG: hypothetical protein JW751_02055 [Polyangiaceae bacterium]|nr:hypothetical protein [Polyangiaceae bacterium]